MYGIPIRLILAGVALLAAFIAGVKVSDWRFEAKRTAALEAQLQKIQVDTARVDGVAAGYERVREALAAVERGKRVEVIRETNRIEYRCELPADGERLRLERIDAANAAAGFPVPAVPADPKDASEGHGRPSAGVFGSDGDVR